MLTGAETKRTRPDAQKYCETCPVCSQPGVDQSIDSAKSLLLLLLCDPLRLQEGHFPCPFDEQHAGVSRWQREPV